MTLETRRAVEPELVKRFRARVDGMIARVDGAVAQANERVSDLVAEAFETRDAEHRAEVDELHAQIAELRGGF